MQKSKVIFCSIAMMLSVWLFSGCTVTGLDAQTMMSPPNANADQKEISRLLIGDKQDVTFVYPKNGEYRSAIIIEDFTGDGIEDAVGFVLPENGGVEVKFLSKDNKGTWRVLAVFNNPATQVDRVCFGDLTGSGSKDVIIGWGNTQNNMSASMGIYSYQNEIINETYAKNPYGEMILTDFDQDNIMEIFAVMRSVPGQDSKEDQAARAELLRFENGELRPVQWVEADNSTVRYAAILFGRITENLYAVVLDGMKADSSMTTQIFYIDAYGRMINIPKGVNDESAVNPLFRPPGAGGTARDINGDGIIEFPVVSLLPSVQDPSAVDSTSFLVIWSAYDAEKREYRPVKEMLMNYAEGYRFTLPKSLIGKITAIHDTKLKAVTYYSVTPQGKKNQDALMNSPLFTVRVFTKNAWKQRGESSGYELLAEKQDYVYGISVLATDSAAQIAIRQIKYSFEIDG